MTLRTLVVILAILVAVWPGEVCAGETDNSATAVVVRSRTGGYLGVGVAEVDSARAQALSLKEERGVEITKVEEGSPAATAGLKNSDVVVEYNGQRVEGTEQFMRLVRETPPGREVRLSVIRASKPETITVKTAARKARARTEVFGYELPDWDWKWEGQLPEIRIPDIPRAHIGWRSPGLGIEGESLESQLAVYFGVKEGVLVRSVLKDSPAEKAGMRAGDVVVKVDERTVTSPREITSALRAAAGDGKKTVTVSLMRDKKPLAVTVAVEDAKAEEVRLWRRR
jgi:serine protease Do